MATISIKTYPKNFKGTVQKVQKAVKAGLLSGAVRCIPLLHEQTRQAPPANPRGVGSGGAVNTGYFLRAWQSERISSNAVRVFNKAIYAGVIEGGRRVGATRPPTKVIEKWAQRRLGLTAKEAKGAAFAIAKAIGKRGLRGRKILARSRGKMKEIVTQEILFEIQRAVG